MVYFPIVGRLNCNSDSKEHRGFWQMDGFGLMAMYKSDWTKLGGMQYVKLNESLKFYIELEAEATNGKRVLVPVFLHLTGG